MSRQSIVNNISADEFHMDKFLDEDDDDDEHDSTLDDTGFPDNLAEFIYEKKKAELVENLKQAAIAWSKIGVPPKKRRQRCAVLDEYLTNCFEEISKTENTVYEECCLYRTEKLTEISKMLSDLNLPAFVVDDGLSLYQLCKRLKQKYAELMKVKVERMERLNELRDKQADLCRSLGIQPPRFKLLSSIPSESELMQLQTAVSDLQIELKRRQEKHDCLKEMIATLMIQLEWTPMNDFESRVITTKDLSEAHLTQTSNFHAKLENEYAKNQKKFESLKNRLESLYAILDVSLDERDRFLKDKFESKPSIIEQFELEVAKYEELKKQNISKFVDKCREQLGTWYDRCYISQEERDKFLSLPIQQNEYNEEMLEVHEKELERIQRYYEDNKTILEKFQKWQDMWLKLIDFEQRANDPNRLNNRGGQLLIEERQRKALQKGLPKVEKELKDLTQVWEDQHGGKKFMILDSDLETFIAGCWDELHQAKEIEKRERQRVKQTEMAAHARGRKVNPVTPGGVGLQRTPVKRLPGNTVTPTPSKMQRTATGSRPMNTPSSSSQANRAHKTVILSSATKSSGQTKSHIPGPTSKSRQVQPLKEPLTSNVTSSHEDASQLSINEQEFEKAVKSCPASARRAR